MLKHVCFNITTISAQNGNKRPGKHPTKRLNAQTFNKIALIFNSLDNKNFLILRGVAPHLRSP